MASTPSTNLKAEKAEQGVTAVWGTKLNRVIDVFDAAIAGLIEVPCAGSDVTLTNVDDFSAVDNGKYAILRCTGSTSTNVIVPTASGFSKSYFVSNEMSSGTITLKTSGHAGVTVPISCAAEILVRNIGGTHDVSYLSPVVVRTTGAPNSGSGAVASAVAVTPTGNLSSTTAQAAFAELQGDVDSINTSLAQKQPLDTDLTTIAGLSNAKGNTIVGNGSAWTALGVGTDGYVPVAKAAASSGIAWAALIPAGTVAIFQQTAAPTGWTKNTTHNDKALRIVSGTASSGGTNAFTTSFAAGRTLTGSTASYTLTVTDIPSHSHFVFNTDFGSGADPTVADNPALYAKFERSTSTDVDYNIKASSTVPTCGPTTTTGGGGGHTHSAGTLAIDMAVQYVDVISATKDAY